jgi:hypothetical protein
MSYTKETIPEDFKLDTNVNKILASWDNEDYFDIQAKKYLAKEREEIQRGWSEVFGEEYNKEIDMHETKDHINPKHYKNVAAGKQYMELMVDMLAGKSGVEAHLFGQVYKYLMRCGNKDQEVQELNKALWYLQALIKFKTEGKVL